YIFPVGRPAPKGDNALSELNYISTEYFQTMRSPLLAGRDFGPADTSQSQKVAIVNQTFARRFFNQEHPLGSAFSVNDANKPAQNPPIEIVGIIKDSPYDDIHEAFPPIAFFPMTQIAGPTSSPTIVVLANAAPSAVVSSIQSVVADSNPKISLQ